MMIYENGGKFKKGDLVKLVKICPKRKNNGRSDHIIRDNRKMYVEGYSSEGNVKLHLLHPKTELKQKSLITFRDSELDFI
ncbi:hypothetical protein [Evansella tamaricis]|uniref:Uncharacterized protein n=1 Tax=Evansella tamaricis TaxID=2069301 RepID=A0ABS6JIZ7_9BACI|nr:hypothetical protein [Evansella tamaricis]MBU9713659.1 hypothetical protein [Evansella tamaricis]